MADFLRSICCAMSFVFISHCSRDKQAIKPIVQALIDAGVKPWVDDPIEMGFTFEETQKHFAGYIKAGNYRHGIGSIDGALKLCGAVLVCWSERGVEDRRVWYSEADHGRRYDMLVCCRIDDLNPAQLQDEFQVQQVYNLCPGDKSPERLKLVVQEVRDKLSRRHSNSTTPRPVVKVLRFAINCDTQARALELGLMPSLNIGVGAAAQRQVYGLTVERADMAERFLWRVLNRELLALCPATAPPLASDPIKIAWVDSGVDQQQRLRSLVEGALFEHDKPDRLGRRGERPAIAYSMIEEPTKATLPLVETWLDSWNNVFKRDAERRLLPVLLFQSVPATWLKQSWSDEIERRFRGFAGTAVRGEVIERLPTLSKDDADRWCRLLDEAGADERTIERFIRERFDERKWRPRLGEFAEEVRDQPWWVELEDRYK